MSDCSDSGDTYILLFCVLLDAPIETLNGSMRGKLDPKNFQSAFLNPI